MQNFKGLANFYGCTGRVYLVEIKDRFTGDEAQLKKIGYLLNSIDDCVSV